MLGTLPCDILVVGAGPAGSSAATAAARAGAKTVMIEAKVRIGEQPHCGEYVPERMFGDMALPRSAVMQRVEYLETRVRSRSKATDSVLSRSRSGADEQNPSRESPRVAGGSQYKRSEILAPGYLIDRVRFDRDLAREAATHGAAAFCGARLLHARDGAWIIQHGEEKKVCRPKFTIAADGACSTVASSMQMGLPAVLKGLQAEVPLVEPLNKTLVFLNQDFVGGYGWLFPKRNVANVGIGVVPGKHVLLSKMLDEFLERLCKEGLIKRGVLARSGGLIPVSGIRDQLVSGTVVFCGDAAGLTHPITGAGIPQAIFSGKLAGHAAAAALTKGDMGCLNKYEAEIRSRYQGIINHALSKRTSMMVRWNDQDFETLCEDTWIGFKGYRKRIRSK